MPFGGGCAPLRPRIKGRKDPDGEWHRTNYEAENHGHHPTTVGALVSRSNTVAGEKRPTGEQKFCERRCACSRSRSLGCSYSSAATTPTAGLPCGRLRLAPCRFDEFAEPVFVVLDRPVVVRHQLGHSG